MACWLFFVLPDIFIWNYHSSAWIIISSTYLLDYFFISLRYFIWEDLIFPNEIFPDCLFKYVIVPLSQTQTSPPPFLHYYICSNGICCYWSYYLYFFPYSFSLMSFSLTIIQSLWRQGFLSTLPTALSLVTTTVPKIDTYRYVYVYRYIDT